MLMQEFSELIALGISLYDRLILNGDLNININKKNESKNIDVLNFLDSFEVT